MKRTWAQRLAQVTLWVGLLAAAAWFSYVAQQVHVASSVDQVNPTDGTQTADAIAIFGAAQYGGRPSPVLHLRLDHAVELYRRHVAGTIVTLGGGSHLDSGRTEGGVGRDYLLAQGVPLADIIAETRSTNTVQQVHRLADLARDHDWHNIVIVSDGTHMFRIKSLCERAGLNVLLSPRVPVGHIPLLESLRRVTHEVVSYTLEQLHWNFEDTD